MRPTLTIRLRAAAMAMTGTSRASVGWRGESLSPYGSEGRVTKDLRVWQGKGVTVEKKGDSLTNNGLNEQYGFIVFSVK